MTQPQRMLVDNLAWSDEIGPREPRSESGLSACAPISPQPFEPTGSP